MPGSKFGAKPPSRNQVLVILLHGSRQLLILRLHQIKPKYLLATAFGIRNSLYFEAIRIGITDSIAEINYK
jgi:predicted outer membrane lipoprotein